MWLLVAIGLLVPQCKVVATTYDGNMYVIGSGDTCKDAVVEWSYLPDDWRRIDVRQEARWVWEL